METKINVFAAFVCVVEYPVTCNDPLGHPSLTFGIPRVAGIHTSWHVGFYSGHSGYISSSDR